MHIALLAAITRAQALLIVIGDSEVLGKYEHWRTFLKYIKSRKGWNGRMHDWDDEVVPPGYETIPSSTSEMASASGCHRCGAMGSVLKACDTALIRETQVSLSVRVYARDGGLDCECTRLRALARRIQVTTDLSFV
jgi:hypothetical protein